MKRAILLSIVFLLTGCPAHFSAIVKNESAEELLFERLNQQPDIVGANQEKKVSWHRGCQIVKVGSSERHLVIVSIPDGSYENVSNRETRFSIVFKGNIFYLQNKEGKLFKIAEQESCNNT